MSKPVETVKETLYETFQLNVGRYTDPKRKLDFPTYEAFVGKKQRRINVKFRKDTKDIPTETCIVTVAVDKMSIDNRNKYPALWIHEIHEVKPLETKDNSKAVVDFFGSREDKDLPF